MLKLNHSNVETCFFFYIYLLILKIYLTYKFVILIIQTNKIIFLVFLKSSNQTQIKNTS